MAKSFGIVAVILFIIQYIAIIRPATFECMENIADEVAMLQDTYPYKIIDENIEVVLGSNTLVPNVTRTVVNEDPVYEVLSGYENFFSRRGYEIERYSGYQPGFYAQRDDIKVNIHLATDNSYLNEESGNIYRIHIICDRLFAQAVYKLDKMIENL